MSWTACSSIFSRLTEQSECFSLVLLLYFACSWTVSQSGNVIDISGIWKQFYINIAIHPDLSFDPSFMVDSIQISMATEYGFPDIDWANSPFSKKMEYSGERESSTAVKYDKWRP